MKESSHTQDQFLKTLFKEVEVKEELSITEKVMQQIQELPAPEPITYEPPISRKAWVLIGSLVALIVVFSMVMESSFSFNLTSYLNSFSGWFGQLGNRISIGFTLPELPSISSHYLTAVLAFNVIGMYFMYSYWRTRKA